jgi:hypothetical protein
MSPKYIASTFQKSWERERKNSEMVTNFSLSGK